MKVLTVFCLLALELITKLQRVLKYLTICQLQCQVFGMSATHLDNKVGTIPLKSYLTQLDALHACPGVTDPELQQFAKMPTTANKSAQTYFLHATYSFPPLLALCAQLALGQKIAIFCQRKSYVLNAHRLM